MKKALTIGGVLIGTYLIVNYATGAGKVLGDGATGTATIIKALQGRGN